jgi:hypothetical protein
MCIITSMRGCRNDTGATGVVSAEATTIGEEIMKIIASTLSALLALSVLAGVAGSSMADENDGKSTNLQQMDRESRGGQGQ